MNARREWVRPLALVGPPASGKTTLGRLLAARLGLDFVDLDDEVERASGQSIPEIFSAEGEAGFRVREIAALACALEDGMPRVIATGAGVTGTAPARALLTRRARVVCLEASAETCLRRAAASWHERPRPLLGEDPASRAERFRALEGGRSQARRALADLCARAEGATPDALADALVQRLAERELCFGRDEDALARACVHIDSTTSPAWAAALAGPSTWIWLDAGCPGARAFAEQHWPGAHLVEMAGGEGVKAPARWLALAEDATKAGVTRDARFIAVGGGALLDAVGMLAATLQRGLSWWAVPTTLLAMVDASLGGKTALNLSVGKNLLGAFHPPRGVWIRPDFVATLPTRARAAGMAELYKHALLAGEESALASLAPLLSAPATGAAGVPSEEVHALAIRRSLAWKARIVEADPREGGVRCILNFGHTLGHVLERVSQRTETPLLHGEAVRHGMLWALAISTQIVGLPMPIAERLAQQVRAIPAPPPPRLGREAWIEGLRVDKKRTFDGVRFIALRGAGAPEVWRVPVEELATAALRWDAWVRGGGPLEMAL